MYKSGYCSGCGRYVPLKANGECAGRHPASCVSDVRVIENADLSDPEVEQMRFAHAFTCIPTADSATYLDLAHLDYAASKMLPHFEEPDVRAQFEAKYSSLRDQANLRAINYCLATFIVAELDARTPGERGLGRVSTDTPRLGAHFRRQMGGMDVPATWRLYYDIQDLMLRGYLAFALFVEDPLRPAKYIDAREIFERWIPGIYASGGQLSEGLRNAIGTTSADAFEALQKRLAEHGMVFKNPANDKLGQIMAYYATGGAGLRAVEVGNNG